MIAIKAAKRNRSIILITIIFIIAILLFCLIEKNLKPIFFDLSLSAMSSLAVECMNDAVLENLNETNYSDLISIRTNSQGQITMLQANTSAMNTLSAKVALSANNKFNNLETQKVSIRLGKLLGFNLLSGFGPLINLSFEPSGSISSSFYSSFEEAGINQTLHTIKMKMTADISIAMGNKSKSKEIYIEVPVSESIIIGLIPSSFASSSSNNASKFDLTP